MGTIWMKIIEKIKNDEDLSHTLPISMNVDDVKWRR